jgi:NADH-quinone oxidoreductase subunit K
MLILFYFINSLSNNFLPLMLCLNFSSILFIIGLVGIVWNKQNFLLMILCIELMFFSISLNFIFFSLYTYLIIGQIFSLLIVTTAASETAIGLSLLIISSRLNNKVSYSSLISLRG